MLISILSPYTLKTLNIPNFGIFRVSTNFFDLDSTIFNHQPTFRTSKHITNEAFLSILGTRVVFDTYFELFTE